MTTIRRGANPPEAALRSCLLTLFALATFAGADRAAAAATESIGLKLVAESDTVRIDETGVWGFTVRMVNTRTVGAYLDSLFLDVRDLGPGVTGVEALTTVDLRHLITSVATMSAGDSLSLSLTQPASCERARLVLRWYGHDGAKVPLAATDSLVAGPGPFELAHPSRFLTVGKKRVEIVEFAPPDTMKSAPGVLLVHGHGSHARSMLRVAGRLSKMGYGVVLVSQPGYGLSEGPADFMGPATVDALAAALGVLRTMPRVDPKRLAAWGVSRGATAVMLLAERQPAGLRSVIAQAGLYDATAWIATAPPSEARNNATAEAGSAADRWTVRSPLAAAARVKADVLLIHGRDDDTSPVGQARALAAALQAGGAAVDTLFVPGGHQVSRGLLARKPLEFLSRLSSR